MVLHHISGRNMMLEEWTLALPGFAQELIRGGYLAVQTFFILSGFVLARSYARAKWEAGDLVRYGAARIARIYPVYLFSLLLVSPFIVETMLKPGRSGAEKMSLLADYGMLLQGWNDSVKIGWNTPAWTLSCEFFFYLCFPLIFPLLRNASWKKVALATLAATVTPVLLAHSGIPWRWKPVHHLSDFVAGIAAARIYQLSRKSMEGRGAWLYLAALAAGIFIIVNPWVMAGTYGDVSTALRPLNVLALLGLAYSGGLLASVLSSRRFDYLGKVSYSMYILHVPVLWWYSYWAMHGPLHMPMLLAAAIYLALVTGLSALAFRFVEVPANRWIRDRVNASLARVPEPVLEQAAAA